CARTARRAIFHFAFCRVPLALPVLLSALLLTGIASATRAQMSVYTRLPPIDGDQPQQQPPLQTAQLLPTTVLPQTVPAPLPSAPPRSSFRKVIIHPRAEGVGPNAESAQSATGEPVAVISGGVNIIVQGLSSDSFPQTLGPLGDVDIEADRIVIWGIDANSGLSGATQQASDPLEIYMEGNI